MHSKQDVVSRTTSQARIVAIAWRYRLPRTPLPAYIYLLLCDLAAAANTHKGYRPYNLSLADRKMQNGSSSFVSARSIHNDSAKDLAGIY